MKRSELVFTAILIPIDFAMLLFAAMLAYFLRFSSSLSETYPVQFELPFGEYFILVLFIIPFWLLIFSLAGLYNLRKKRRLIDDFYSVFLGVSTGMTALVLLIFFRHELFSSRFLVVANWFLAIIFVTIGRVIIKMIRAYLYRYDYGTRRVIIIGQSQECKYLVNHFQNDIGAGYRVINHFKELEKEEIKKIRRNVERGKVDEIINCDPEIPKGKTARLIEIADAARVQYKYIPDFFETKATNIDVNTVAGIPVVALKRTPLDGWWQIIKRLLDFVISFFGLIVLSPLMGLV
ncbi:hypothetical protein KKC60_01335, partial [Patescibacteria group bacterium]|nr:hypothetical protein [Patescibacteria group bacterium]